MLKKYAVAFMIVFSILINTVSLPAFAADKTADNNSALAVSVVKNEDYSAYLKTYENAPLSTEAIEIKVNFILGSDKKDFSIDVAKEGL